MARIFAPSVDHEVEHAVSVPEGLNALLAIVLPDVNGFDEFWIVEDGNGLREIDLPPFPILGPFVLVPFKNHSTGIRFVYQYYPRDEARRSIDSRIAPVRSVATA